MTEETQALVAFAGTWVCHHFNPESGADCRELHKGDPDMWCSSCVVLDLAAALTTLAGDLETARQERDAARREAERYVMMLCNERAANIAAVRAARAETWAEAAEVIKTTSVFRDGVQSFSPAELRQAMVSICNKRARG